MERQRVSSTQVPISEPPGVTSTSAPNPACKAARTNHKGQQFAAELLFLNRAPCTRRRAVEVGVARCVRQFAFSTAVCASSEVRWCQLTARRRRRLRAGSVSTFPKWQRRPSGDRVTPEWASHPGWSGKQRFARPGNFPGRASTGPGECRLGEIFRSPARPEARPHCSLPPCSRPSGRSPVRPVARPAVVAGGLTSHAICVVNPPATIAGRAGLGRASGRWARAVWATCNVGHLWSGPPQAGPELSTLLPQTKTTMM